MKFQHISRQVLTGFLFCALLWPMTAASSPVSSDVTYSDPQWVGSFLNSLEKHKPESQSSGSQIDLALQLIQALWEAPTRYDSLAQRADYFQVMTQFSFYELKTSSTNDALDIPAVVFQNSWLWAQQSAALSTSEKEAFLQELVRKIELTPEILTRSLFETPSTPRARTWADGRREPIATKSFAYKASAPGQVLQTTIQKLRSVFRRYRPAFDSGTSIVKPLEITGTEARPRLQITVKKCVLFVCETVALDALVSLQELTAKGNCTRQFVLNADLSRSSEILAKNYKALQVDICYRETAGSGQLKMDAFAVQAAGYSSGVVTQEIFKMLSMQITPMTNALTESLIANGARL